MMRTTKDRIRYLRTKVDYPQQDDDQAGGGIGGGPVTTTDNKLDIYLYNGTDEEIANSTGLSNDNRNAGDCGSDDYCVWLVIGASTVRRLPTGGLDSGSGQRGDAHHQGELLHSGTPV